ncbi:PLP-dependent aminotransferase family protein [Paenibacillus sp. SI8]|uniref:MocR-like pyridoxine biosynthesis transcription factor PdxR n=1 Tax=unclassified Paenibacillus TaxID=185978 RepID=UPI003467E474
MFISLDRTIKKPLWLQIADALLEAIRKGQLKSNETIWPSRVYAKELGVSRSTVQLAFEELVAQGYLVTFGKGGTRVAELTYPTEKIPQLDPPKIDNSQNSQPIDWLRIPKSHHVDIHFMHHEPYIDHIFMNAWASSSAAAMKRMKDSDWGYTDARGAVEARQQIRQYLALEKGLHLSLAQVMLLPGTQRIIDLIAQGLLNPGDRVAVEDPGYPAAQIGFLFRGMIVDCIPVDAHGLRVDLLHPKTKLIFVTPAHQRPTGIVMSAPRRMALVAFANQHHAWIVEDDYDGEYRYHGSPLPTLYSSAMHTTLYIKSFSKLLAPGLRLSALVGPAQALDRIANVMRITERQASILEQQTLAEFFASGLFAKHLSRLRRIYRKRHDVLLSSLHEYKILQRLQLVGAETGLNVLLEGETRFQEAKIIEAALQRRIGLHGLQPYCFQVQRKGLLIGFSKTDEASIQTGIRQLAAILEL